jgi:hypothetical protein
MSENMKKRIIALILPALIVMSCSPFENLPDEPKVEFRSFTLFDSTDILGNKLKAGVMTFYFEDGNGDLGLSDPDSTSTTDTTNLFLTLYRKNNGVFKEVDDNDILKPSAYRIPYLIPIGQNDILRGTVDITLLYFIYKNTDTLYYDYWVKDRAGNISNIDSTCVIVLGNSGIFTR